MLYFPEALEDIELGRRRLALDEFIGLRVKNPGAAKTLLPEGASAAMLNEQLYQTASARNSVL